MKYNFPASAVRVEKAIGSAANIEGSIHVDGYLTGFSEMYLQDESSFVAGQASSLIQVAKQTDKYVSYDRGSFWRDEVTQRPLGGRPAQASYKTGEGNYNAEEWALEHIVDDRQRANADDPIKLDENATRMLTQKMMIRADRLWFQNFFSTGIWTTDMVAVASGGDGVNTYMNFSDDTSDPVDTIDRVKQYIHQRTGFMPNTMVLGADVRRRFRVHPDLVDRIKYTERGIITDDLLAALFEVDNLVTARGIYNAAAEGATADFQYIANKRGIWLGYIEPNPTLDSPTAVANFAWTGLIPGQGNKFGGVMTRGRDDRAYSDFFHNRMAFDLKRVAPDLGAFMENAVN